MTVSLRKSSPTFLGTALSTEHKGQATFRCVWKHEPWKRKPGARNRAPSTGGRGLRGPWERVSWVMDFQWPCSCVRAECSAGHPPGKPGTSKECGVSRCLGTQAHPLWFHCPKHLGLLCGLKWLLQPLLPSPLPSPPTQQYTRCQGTLEIYPHAQ